MHNLPVEITTYSHFHPRWQVPGPALEKALRGGVYTALIHSDRYVPSALLVDAVADRTETLPPMSSWRRSLADLAAGLEPRKRAA